MSTSTEITRLQTARNLIRDKLIELGLASSTAKLDALATAVDGIENKGAVSATVQEGATYTIPKGYHNGAGTVSGVAGGGNYTLQSKAVTPTKKQQTVTPDQGFYGLSDVTVQPIPEAYANVSGVTAVAGDVLANKVIVDATGKTVAGTMPNNGAVTKVLDTSEGNESFTIPEGYHDGKGKVSIGIDFKTVTPTEAQQIIVPGSGKVLGSVTVGSIPAAYISANVIVGAIHAQAGSPQGQATDADLIAGGFLWGWDEEKQTVVKIEGTMKDNGAVSATIDGLSTTVCTIPKGYHNGSGKVSLTADIENALAAI